MSRPDLFPPGLEPGAHRRKTRGRAAGRYGKFSMFIGVMLIGLWFVLREIQPSLELSLRGEKAGTDYAVLALGVVLVIFGALLSWVGENSANN